MRTIIMILSFIPFFAIAQKQEVFLRLTDASGRQINGDALARGYERNINVITNAGGGKNNTQLSFTMNIIGASADLKRVMASGELLTNGQLSVVVAGEKPAFVYTVKMEKIRVLSCSESMGCNGVMTTAVTLQATRIGWTYYQTGKTGIAVVSNKYGFDSETGGQWSNF